MIPLDIPKGIRSSCKISSLLKTSVRKKDTVARYGGEEFILILPEAGLEESFVIAETHSANWLKTLLLK